MTGAQGRGLAVTSLLLGLGGGGCMGRRFDWFKAVGFFLLVVETWWWIVELVMIWIGFATADS